MSKGLDYLEYGRWYPIEKYFENKSQMDWALVQFKEIKSGFMGLPHIAELRRDNKWHIECDDKESYLKYINEDCKPIAFMLWKPYDENSSLESIDNANPSEAMKHMEFICKILKEKGIDIKWLFKEDYKIIMQALQRLDKYEQILGSGRLTDRNYKNTTLDLDSCKPYVRLGQLEDIYEEGKKNE